MNADGEKKDLIFLDARLTHQVSVRAFRAELSNGHRLVAYARGDLPREPAVGDTVKVCLSPFDMSVGKIIFEDVK
jgi:translation initiation factor IF-1